MSDELDPDKMFNAIYPVSIQIFFWREIYWFGS